MAKKPTLLKKADLTKKLPLGWKVAPNGKAIQCKLEFSDFTQAWGFMNCVALRAEGMGHHPDWSNSYNKVSVKLSTHEAGGVTQADIDLASFINSLVD